MKKLFFYYPLRLPIDFKHTAKLRKYHRHKITLKRALSMLRKNIDILNLYNCRLYTNAIILDDKIIESFLNQGTGAIFYFTMGNKNIYLASDKYFTLSENIFCIARALDGYVLIHKNCKAMEYELITQNQ